jgi:hypothetical protein
MIVGIVGYPVMMTPQKRAVARRFGVMV